MAQGIMNKNTVKGNYPEYMDSPEFMEVYRLGRKSLARETPVPVGVDKESMDEVRTPEFAFSKYEGDGYELKLKVGKWETNGVKEVWQAKLSKGINLEYDYPHCNWELYYITEGAVQFTIMDQTFTAGPDCLVHIPPFHKHRIKVLEDSQLYDYGCEMHLMSLLEDLESVKKYNPEKLEDPAFVTPFLRKYGCYITKFYKE